MSEKSKEPEPIDWPERARKLLNANLVNLGKKVLQGETLTAAEVKLLQSVESKPERAEPTETEAPAFAQNQSQLAAILGVSRQLVSYHAKQDSSPGSRADGRYNVAEWRKYFAAFGRIRISPGQSSGRPSIKLDFGDAVSGAINAMGRNLPHCLNRALEISGVGASKAATQRTAFVLFLLLASTVDDVAVGWGFPSYFEPDEDGNASYPAEIVAAAKHQPEISL